MAAPVGVLKGRPLPTDEHLYRALNPIHLENGLPSDNHFVMSQNHDPDDGVSTGIASLISLTELRSIALLAERCGKECAVAELIVSEIVAPVAPLGISVLQQDAPEWANFAGAHAVITGYQALRGNDGRRKIRDFQRHLVRLARNNFYPQGSCIATSSTRL